jgi:Family of unknown function (DUF5752)
MSLVKGAAERILAKVSHERGFHFYIGLGVPTDVFALSLQEFGAKLKTVDVKSLEFHTRRGDFEKWAYMLGDGELAKSLMKLREDNTAGERLREELVRIVQTRVRLLQKSAAKKP